MEVCICIPTKNEEESIGQVIEGFQKTEYGDNIIVVDGNSVDATKDVATAYDIEFYTQSSQQGKGAAMKESVHELIDKEITVFVDGDLTYEPTHVTRLVDPILSYDHIKHVLGNRFGDMKPGSMSKLHQLGNKIFNYYFAMLYQKNVKDILTGYRAIETEYMKNMDIQSNHFTIESEITAKTVLDAKEKIQTVDSAYYEREGESELNSIEDGFKIFRAISNMRFNG